MKALAAIRKYFKEEPNAQTVPVDELKALSLEDRDELGALACEELGTEFEPTDRLLT